MATSASTHIVVDHALSATGASSLSYVHHNLKWLIRQHLLALLHDYPTLSPSADLFTHDDGTTVNLLNAHGALPASPAAPPVLLTIWLHQCYPFKPPLVYVFPLNSSTEIHHDHPFIDSSGATMFPYLQNWQYPHSNLSDLARNLVHVFTICSPYNLGPTVVGPSGSPKILSRVFVDQPSVQSEPYSRFPSAGSSGSPKTGSLAARREATDQLIARLLHDKACFQADVEGGIEHLSCLQAALRERAGALTAMLRDLEEERESLERAMGEKVVDVDELSRWLSRVRDMKAIARDEMEVFEAGDERSRCLIESKAADLAIDDAVDALGKALEDGVVGLKDYLKQLRGLAREQFFHRVLTSKLEQS